MVYFIADVSTIADWLSIIGFVLSIVGFVVTIWGVWRSRAAAEAAAEAARDAKTSVMRDSSISGIAEAITMMEEIKRLHRLEAWAILPDRYSFLRKTLIGIQASNPRFSDDFKTIVQTAIQQVSDAERKVEKANAGGAKQPAIGRLNDIFSDLINRLTELRTAILNGRTE